MSEEFAQTALPESPDRSFNIAVLSDVGTNRPDNEDSCGYFVDGDQCVIFAVADGIGGYNGGEVASAMAVKPPAGVATKSRRVGRGKTSHARRSGSKYRNATARSRCPNYA